MTSLVQARGRCAVLFGALGEPTRVVHLPSPPAPTVASTPYDSTADPRGISVRSARHACFAATREERGHARRDRAGATPSSEASWSWDERSPWAALMPEPCRVDCDSRHLERGARCLSPTQDGGGGSGVPVHAHPQCRKDHCRQTVRPWREDEDSADPRATAGLRTLDDFAAWPKITASQRVRGNLPVPCLPPAVA